MCNKGGAVISRVTYLVTTWRPHRGLTPARQARRCNKMNDCTSRFRPSGLTDGKEVAQGQRAMDVGAVR